MTASTRLGAAGVVLGLVLAGLSGPPAGAHQRDRGYSAEIRRASYGVPHITATSYANLGFGVGYVQAEDNLCVIAEKAVTVSGERSRYFGATGPTDANVRSDLFFRKAIEDRTVERLLDGRRDGVHSPSNDVRDQIRGFVAGYNSYLRRTGAARLTDPACRAKPWVRPLTELDIWRTTWDSMIRAGSGALLDGIVAAAPPTATGPAAVQDATGAAAVLASVDGAPAGVGSNAYGLGEAATANRGGMVLANPHFPWEGAERFYRMHLKVPGRYDVEGAALIGDPIIEIGHNRTLAWSHTVSTARRFVWHRLALVPGDPTSYYVDGQPRKMTTRTVTVRVPGPNGGTVPVSRTFHDTHYGPVVVVPGSFDWTASTAYAITDINATNNRAFDGWLQMGRAETVRDLKRVLDRYQFLPWVNVIAADARGEALYADHSVVPRVTDALAAACIPAPFQPLYASSGQAVLDGSRSACALGADPDAAVPGILGPANLPVRFRTDYVTNSNDSFWLANPEAPLEGYARIIGDERTPAACVPVSASTRCSSASTAPTGYPAAGSPPTVCGGPSSATGCTAANWSATTWWRSAPPSRPGPPRTARRSTCAPPARHWPAGICTPTWTAAAHTCSPSSPWPTGCASRSPSPSATPCTRHAGSTPPTRAYVPRSPTPYSGSLASRSTRVSATSRPSSVATGVFRFTAGAPRPASST